MARPFGSAHSDARRHPRRDGWGCHLPTGCAATVAAGSDTTWEVAA